ncbi:MAG: AAA family ATPase, partial [Pseudomonadota bacterium]
RIREMVELPMRQPEVFQHLGIIAPRGVLLSGPPGTGKTLLARAVAHECEASFFQINGPEIVGKHYGESEKQLREIFQRAEAEQPAIIFIDELDAIAPNREKMHGDRQVERRIVGQLLTLLDGLTNRGQVVVMGATNLPNTLDPALRRPGRFDREVQFTAPDRMGRREIIGVHTEGMPLDDSVDLDALATMTHGYVGADLAALVREAGMAAVRRVTALDGPQLVNAVDALRVDMSDFEDAFREIVPSAMREVFTEVPDIDWDDVGGHDQAKQILIESVIWPLRHGDVYAKAGVKPPRGVLLSGQPGTGKTLLARTLASEAGVSFISVRGPQLLSQYVGESERAIRDVFQKARHAAPCILFFDEIDALLPRRGSEAGAVLDRVVAQFLTEIDGAEELRGVFVLAATNRPDQVDTAVVRPGRFDLTIEIGMPDAATRTHILSIHSRQQTLSPDVDMSEIGAKLEGTSGAELQAVTRQAALVAVRRLLNSANGEAVENVVVTKADYATAVAEIIESRQPTKTRSAP